MEIRLDHCVMHVSDRRRSNTFYREVLGAEARDPVRPGNSDLCFVWPGPIEDAINHLSAHSVGVELGPVRRQGAGGEGRSVYFRDPDGSLLEFISYA